MKDNNFDRTCLRILPGTTFKIISAVSVNTRLNNGTKLFKHNLNTGLINAVLMLKFHSRCIPKRYSQKKETSNLKASLPTVETKCSPS